jgi:hypothetical protein
MSIEAGGADGQVTGGDAGGGQPDVMAMLGHVPTLMQQHQQVAQKVDKSSEVINKLEQVFSKSEPSPDQWYDDVLRSALEAEKQGTPIPNTLKISNVLLAQQNLAKQLQAELAALKQKEDLRNNPQYQMDQAAYTQIDQAMAQELSQAYGGQIPKHVAAAVTQDLVQRIQYSQQHEPETWQKVRANPEMMRHIVRNAIGQAVPPEARRIQQQNQIQNATYSPDDIHAAIREAQELMQSEEVQRNPRMMQKLNESITKSREMLWETMIPGTGRRSRV